MRGLRISAKDRVAEVVARSAPAIYEDHLGAVRAEELDPKIASPRVSDVDDDFKVLNRRLPKISDDYL